MKLKKLGVIHSPYDRDGENKAPKQGLDSVESTIEVYQEFQDALYKLKSGDEILVIYWGDKSDRSTLISKCKGVGPEKGVFALRSPHRPNPLLVTKCRIKNIQDNKINVIGLEALDESPLVDIKISID